MSTSAWFEEIRRLQRGFPSGDVVALQQALLAMYGYAFEVLMHAISSVAEQPQQAAVLGAQMQAFNAVLDAVDEMADAVESGDSARLHAGFSRLETALSAIR